MAIGLISLAASAKTYLASVNRKELMMAQVQPGSVTVNPYSLSGFNGTGKMRMYLKDLGQIQLTVSGVHSGSYLLVEGQMKETDFSVCAGEIVTILVQYEGVTEKPYGWVTPTDPAAGTCKDKTDPIVAQAQANGESIVSVECWNDDGSDTDPFDDFEIIITQVGGGGGSRPDYCVSASADGIAGGRVTKNVGETLTLSSVSNTAVNGFFWIEYNLDNLYNPGNTTDPNPKPVCVGNETTGRPAWASNACPISGYPLIFSDPWNQTNGTGLRTEGSAQIPYASLFVNDKNWGDKQAINLQFNAYFSLNGGEFSWPQKPCVVYAVMGTVASPSPSPSPSVSPSPSPSPSPLASASPKPSASPGIGGTGASPSPSPSPSPASGGNEASASPAADSGTSPSQPDTGSPTWLTAGALLTGLGLLMIKLLLKI